MIWSELQISRSSGTSAEIEILLTKKNVLPPRANVNDAHPNPYDYYRATRLIRIFLTNKKTLMMHVQLVHEIEVGSSRIEKDRYLCVAARFHMAGRVGVSALPSASAATMKYQCVAYRNQISGPSSITVNAIKDRLYQDDAGTFYPLISLDRMEWRQRGR